MWPLLGRGRARKFKFKKRNKERNEELVMSSCLGKAGGVCEYLFEHSQPPITLLTTLPSVAVKRY